MNSKTWKEYYISADSEVEYLNGFHFKLYKVRAFHSFAQFMLNDKFQVAIL